MTLWKRLRMFWVFIAAGAIAAIAAGYTLATRPEFRVRSITVSGNHAVSQQQIVAAAAISLDANVWLLNTGAIAGRIEAIPFIATANVHRSLPADVELAVTERTPAACVVAKGVALTIDAGRRVLASRCLSRALPRYELTPASDPKPGGFLADAQIARLQRDLGVVASGGYAARSARFDEYGSLNVTTTTGLLLRLGSDDDLQSKVRLIGPILEATKKRLRAVEAIDLRAPTTPIVTYRPGR
jgi:cell division protein FtsQ